MKNPKFSIVVPTYNQRDYLAACLDSVIAQTDGDWEAVVINDGSTDGTAELADDYAARDPRIRVFHKANGGVASALNEGLRQAGGQWIHWLSSDDLFDPRKLEINRQAIAEFPDCKFFFSYFRLLRQSTQEISDHGLWGPLPDRELQIPTLFFRNYISGITICIERAAWLSVGFFDESLRYAQDYDMWLRLLEQFPARFIDQWTVTNRNHALQGSEIFADACYYDTAKAAMLFLNRTSFASLFPLLDLTNPAHAVRAIECALATAAERSSFLYALGWNPSLLWRTLEWVFEVERRDPSFGKRLRTKARWICRRTARQLGKCDSAFAWKTASSMLAIGDMRTAYRPLDPVETALSSHTALASVSDPRANSIAEYLKRFHQIAVPMRGGAWQSGEIGGGVAIFLDCKGGAEELLLLIRPLLRELEARGLRSVVFIEGAPRCWFEGITSVIVGPRSNAVRLLQQFANRCVLAADIAHAKFPPNCLVLPLNAAEHADPLATIVTGLSASYASSVEGVSNNSSDDRVPLVFLIRALHGGGAERVLFDLVHALNDARFTITIIPLFESAHTPQFKKGNVVASFELSRPQAVAVISEPPPVVTALPALIVTIASKLSPEQRRRIKSLPFFPAAQFALRGIAAVYRKARYGAPHSRGTEHFQDLSSGRDENVSADNDCHEAGVDISENEGLPVERRSSAQNALIGSLEYYSRMAAYVSDVIRPLGSRAIVVGVMEEAAIVAWLTSLQVSVRYLTWLHTVESLYLQQLFPDDEVRRDHNILLHTAVARAERCVFPSQGCADDLMLLYGIPAHQFKTIHNPIDLRAVAKLAEEMPEKPISLDSSMPLIVSLGRLSPEKGHDLLLEALSQIQQRHKEFLCLIIGSGGTSDAISALIDEYGLGNNVKMLGAVLNPFPYLAKADALVLTSKFESFALVLVEAMAAGVIPISVDCPTGPREVLDHGRAGILVPANDARALAEAIEKTLWYGQDNEKLLAHASLWVNAFDISAVSSEWDQLFTDVVSDGVNRAKIERPDTQLNAAQS